MSKLKLEVAVANQSGAMEAETISKHGRSLKSQMSRENFYNVCVLLLMVIAFSSCATIFSGTKQKISVNSQPTGARIYVNGQDQNVITPTTINVKRGKSATYTFQLQGYPDGVVNAQSVINPLFFGNLLLGLIVGMAVDMGTGAWREYYNTNVSYNFVTQQESTTKIVTSRGCIEYEIIKVANSYQIIFTCICSGRYKVEYQYWDGRLWQNSGLTIRGGSSVRFPAGTEGKVRNVYGYQDSLL